MQKEFIQKIKASRPNETIIDLISEGLDIGYDAAYRRVKGLAKLSFEEAIILAKRYKISLNDFLEDSVKQTVLVEKYGEINAFEELHHYISRSQQRLNDLKLSNQSSILYSARDLPLFYSLKKPNLCRFKLFAWLRILDQNQQFQQIHFDQFNPSPLIFKECKTLSDTYESLAITEFWNHNTLDSTLYQIKYFVESGNLSVESARLIGEDIRELLTEIKQRLLQHQTAQYALYLTEIHSLSNINLLKKKNELQLYVPYSILSYFRIEQKETCQLIDRFFEKQKRSSKLLSHCGERDQNLFFNRLLKRLDQMLSSISLTDF